MNGTITLSQKKLDASNKKRANLFNWRGQFTPELVEYLLKEFGNEGDMILDPFSGSGTVLLEAIRKETRAHGFEINPAAYAMSQFYTFCNWNTNKREALLKSFEDLLNKHLPPLNGIDLFTPNTSYRKSYSNLLEFCQEIAKEVKEDSQQILLQNLLFLSEKDKKLKLRDSISKSYFFIKKALRGLPYTEKKIKATLDDARNTYKYLQGEVDLIITSPPYINVFNYHQNYRAIVETFGFEILKVAHSEFGSNRKNRGNRFKTVVQYCLDMEAAISSFWHSLKPNGKMILVVGRESNVRRTPFYNGKIVEEIIQLSEGFDILQIEERGFSNKFGKYIKEDIIIAEKKDTLPNLQNGRNIARRHLEKAFALTNSIDIQKDIEKTLAVIASIETSPLFDFSKIIKK